MLYVDTRWAGNHGIGRYAQEVCSRIQIPFSDPNLDSRVASYRDLLSYRKFQTWDLLYSPGYNAAPSNIEQLVTVHDLIHLRFGSFIHRTYYETVLKHAIRKSGAVLTVSNTASAEISDWVGANVEVINTGNGISESFRPRVNEIHGEPPYILYVGNAKKHKNAAVLFAALTHNTELRLKTVGLTKAQVQGLCADYEVFEQVEVILEIDDQELASLYQQAAATAIPSLHEGFGLPAAESIATGTPVLFWGGCESIREIVGSEGISLDGATSGREWAEVMTHAVRNPMRVDSARVIHDYSWDSVASKVEEAVRGRQ